MHACMHAAEARKLPSVFACLSVVCMSHRTCLGLSHPLVLRTRTMLRYFVIVYAPDLIFFFLFWYLELSSGGGRLAAGFSVICDGGTWFRIFCVPGWINTAFLPPWLTALPLMTCLPVSNYASPP